MDLDLWVTRPNVTNNITQGGGASGSLTLVATADLSGLTSYDFTGLTGSDAYIVAFAGESSVGAADGLLLAFNDDTNTANYSASNGWFAGNQALMSPICNAPALVDTICKRMPNGQILWHTSGAWIDTGASINDSTNGRGIYTVNVASITAIRVASLNSTAFAAGTKVSLYSRAE